MRLRDKRALALALLTAGLVPLAAQAESNLQTGGTSTLTATARVDFRIEIPRLLFLQVGTGTRLVTDTTVDLISFNPAVGVIGNGTAVGGTGGDLPGGAVTVRVIGNIGEVRLTAAGTTALTNGGGNTIPWTEISTAVTGGVAHPTIGSGTVTLSPSANVVNASGTWTYSYLNTAVPAAGQYNGTVTYTATSP